MGEEFSYSLKQGCARRSLETLMEYQVQQGILEKKPEIEELFFRNVGRFVEKIDGSVIRTSIEEPFACSATTREERWRIHNFSAWICSHFSPE